MPDVIVVRCPQCGSTDAGEVDGFLEFTTMRCAVCGHEDVCDEYQIKDGWNVRLTLAQGATKLPLRVEPELRWPCESCRAAPLSFSVSAGARDQELPRMSKLHGIRACTDCRTCYRFTSSPDGVDALERLDRATSRALRELAAGTLTQHMLAGLSLVDGFDLGRIEDALTPDLDLRPILEWLRSELASGRAIRWTLVDVAARAGADVLEFVPAVSVALAGATDDAALLTGILDAIAERGGEVGPALDSARTVLQRDAWLWEARPHLARLCG